MLRLAARNADVWNPAADGLETNRRLKCRAKSTGGPPRIVRLSIPREQPDDLQGAWSSVQAGNHRDALILGCDFNGHQAG